MVAVTIDCSGRDSMLEYRWLYTVSCWVTDKAIGKNRTVNHILGYG